jgi:hypothetical protein
LYCHILFFIVFLGGSCFSMEIVMGSGDRVGCIKDGGVVCVWNGGLRDVFGNSKCSLQGL